MQRVDAGPHQCGHPQQRHLDAAERSAGQLGLDPAFAQQHQDEQKQHACQAQQPPGTARRLSLHPGTQAQRQGRIEQDPTARQGHHVGRTRKEQCRRTQPECAFHAGRAAVESQPGGNCRAVHADLAQGRHLVAEQQGRRDQQQDERGRQPVPAIHPPFQQAARHCQRLPGPLQDRLRRGASKQSQHKGGDQEDQESHRVSETGDQRLISTHGPLRPAECFHASHLHGSNAASQRQEQRAQGQHDGWTQGLKEHRLDDHGKVLAILPPSRDGGK